MALGMVQRPARILRMVLSQGAIQLAIGLGLGLALAFTISIVGRDGIANALFSVSPRDPLTYSLVSLLAIVAFIATIVPARRATRVDPMIALRAE